MPVEFRLGLRLRAAKASWGRRGTLAMVTLQVPLDRLTQRPLPGMQPASRSQSECAISATGSLESIENASLATDPDPVPESAPSSAVLRLSGSRPGTSAISLEATLARDTITAALKAAGFAASSERLTSLSTRARVSAALPELRFKGGRSTDESLRLSPTSTDPYRYSQAGGYELSVELQLTWKLDRLVFSTAELRVETLRRQRAQAKARLVRAVLQALFAWQRARIKLATATLLPEERALVVLEQMEAEAVLGVYTAGWFTRRFAPR